MMSKIKMKKVQNGKKYSLSPSSSSLTLGVLRGMEAFVLIFHF